MEDVEVFRVKESGDTPEGEKWMHLVEHTIFSILSYSAQEFQREVGLSSFHFHVK